VSFAPLGATPRRMAGRCSAWGAPRAGVLGTGGEELTLEAIPITVLAERGPSAPPQASLAPHVASGPSS